MKIPKFYVGDIIQTRKVHPCGGDQWEVMRVGIDFRIRCLKCGRMVMLPRPKFERAVKKVIQPAYPLTVAGSARDHTENSTSGEEGGKNG